MTWLSGELDRHVPQSEHWGAGSGAA